MVDDQLFMTAPNRPMNPFNQELELKKENYCDALKESVGTNITQLNRQQKYAY